MIKKFAEAVQARNMEQLMEMVHTLNVEEKNSVGRTGLHIASYHGYKELCEILLERGSDLDSMDNWGDTALHSASIYNHPEIVKLLIERGANIDAQSNYGLTPLLLAIGNSRWRVANLLLRFGADPNQITSYGTSAFRLSCRQRNPKWKLLMMKHGQFLNDENKSALNKLYFHVSW